MLPTVRPRINHGTVVAYLALFVALGGSSYAAVQLSNGSVKSRHIATNAVVSAKVKNGSLLRRDFRVGQLPAGAVGPQGQRGATGAPGLAGAKGDPGQKGDAAVALWAVVNQTGTMRRGKGVVAVQLLGSTGLPYFVVRFDRDVSACAALASLEQNSANQSQIGGVAASPQRSPEIALDSVLVQTYNAAGELSAKDFTVSMLC